MDYIVLDLEWNQGQKPRPKVDAPLFEIIEIGALKLNENFELVDIYESLVKPQIHHSMHKITADLVHLKMSDLKGGRPFELVAKEFLDWCGEDYTFCIWGVQDLTEWQKNMEYYHMSPLSNGPIPYYDVQKLYGIYSGDKKKRAALHNVVEAEQMVEEDVSFHRALGDAYYTARVLKHIANDDLLKMLSFDTYHIPADKRKQIYWKFDDYTKFISRGFYERAEMMGDKGVSCMKCIHCERSLRKKVPWFTPNNGKHYYTIAECRKHGLMKGKIRVRRSKDEKYYVIKTIKAISKQEAEEVLSKKKKQKDVKTSFYFLIGNYFFKSWKIISLDFKSTLST